MKIIPIQKSFINISKLHKFVFFNSKLSAKSSVFPYIFHTKKTPFFFFLQKYTWNIININNYAKIEKNNEADFSNRNQLEPPYVVTRIECELEL